MNIFNQNRIDTISQLLQEREQTIAIAESCTSGLIQNAFSQATKATSFFQGGMTVYNLGQKAKHLCVNPISAEKFNSVSKEISDKMAIEIAKAFNAELGVAITGYAKPMAELSIDECYAYISIAEKQQIILTKRIEGNSSKNLFENQCIFVEKTLENLLKCLEK